MFRVDTPTATAVMPPLKPAGTQGWFTEGGAGQSPTIPGADWFNIVQAELMGVLTAAGVTPDKTKLNQLAGAISRLAGRVVTTVTSADSPRTLTVAETGLVLVDASAGAVTLNLPAADGNGGLGYTVIRTDSAANTVTVVPDGTETVDGAAFISVEKERRYQLLSDGSGTWQLLVPFSSESMAGLIQLAAAADAQGLADLTKALTPGALDAALKGGNQSLSGNGYQKLPGGLIIQWGTGTYNQTTVSFPITFPNMLLSLSGAVDTRSISGNGESFGFRDEGLSSFVAQPTSNGGDTAGRAYWIAIGF